MPGFTYFRHKLPFELFLVDRQGCMVYQYQKNTALLKVMVLYIVGLLIIVCSILHKSLHVDEISSRLSCIKTPAT